MLFNGVARNASRLAFGDGVETRTRFSIPSFRGMSNREAAISTISGVATLELSIPK